MADGKKNKMNLPWLFDHDKRRNRISIKNDSGDEINAAKLYGGEYDSESDAQSIAEFQFITRACNAHDDLVAAIKEYLEWGPMTASDKHLLDEKFRAAISKSST